jgi:PKD repeat protein
MSGAGSTDPDNDALTYAWNFGDGATGTGVNVSHAYAAAGTYTVQLIVTDPLGLADTVTTTATVKSQAQATQEAKLLVASLLSSGKLNNGTANSLNAKLNAAIAAFNAGDNATAVSKLNDLKNEVNAMINSGRLSAADAAALIAAANRIIASAS